MSSFTSLFLVVACTALLAGCEARQHRQRRPNRRNAWDASISLGSVQGSDIKPLPELQINGPDVIIGFADNCILDNGKQLLGAQVVVSNNDQGPPPLLSADDQDDPLSNLSISCDVDDNGDRCLSGVTIVAYQFCGPAPTTTTPPPSTTAPSSTTTAPSSSPSDYP